jgi:hypothetical protein
MLNRAFLFGSPSTICLAVTRGNNAFTLCGGSGTGSITLGFNTLAVRIAK